MALNSNNQLKFQEGTTTEPLKVVSAGMEELEFGSKFVVHIKQTIEGYDHFLPSPGLEKKIKEENADTGDMITIEKVAKSEKYPYGFFTVKVVEKSKLENSPVGAGFIQKDVKHKSVENFEKQFEPKNDKMDLHELNVRVEKLEKMVTILSSEAGHKPGDEKLPF
tara:strand:+ start:1339 stop:1833 length:495 start_codon:yes stop_codon:yes gene_type:complete